MISNSWNKTEGETISQKVMGKVKPDEPLKNKIDFAQKKLQFQISKLDGINEKLQKKHDTIFKKIVNAQRNNKPGSLNGIMPEANASMQDLSEILGDVMSGSSVGIGDSMSTVPETNADTLAILEEAHSVIAGQTKSSIPDVPDSLKQQIVEKKTDIFI